jgi:hypothetical protein
VTAKARRLDDVASSRLTDRGWFRSLTVQALCRAALEHTGSGER